MYRICDTLSFSVSDSWSFALLFTAMLLCCACLLMCFGLCDINSELLEFGISIACDAELICQLKCGFNMVFAWQVELWRVNYYAYATVEWRTQWKVKHWMVEFRNVNSTSMSKGCGHSWKDVGTLGIHLPSSSHLCCLQHNSCPKIWNLLSCIHVFGEQHHTSCFQDPKLDGNLDHFKG